MRDRASSHRDWTPETEASLSSEPLQESPHQDLLEGSCAIMSGVVSPKNLVVTLDGYPKESTT